MACVMGRLGVSSLFFLCFCYDPLCFLGRWREAMYLHVSVASDISS